MKMLLVVIAALFIVLPALLVEAAIECNLDQCWYYYGVEMNLCDQCTLRSIMSCGAFCGQGLVSKLSNEPESELRLLNYYLTKVRDNVISINKKKL